ncbi:MAG: helicase [Oscillospiraceae bacterium]|nr:helicase [Oscillospiraceae bacterium]
MSSKDKTWSAGTLKSRGWTEALIAALLSKPQYRYFSGRRVRTWRIEEVRQAERSEDFQNGRAAPAPNPGPGADIAAEEALRAAAELLAAAWASSPTPPEESVRALAEKYHAAILSQVPHVSWAARLKVGQCTSYIDQFLHLRNNAGGAPLSGVLRRFITAMVWLGRNTASPQALRLQERYGETLYAIAARDIEAFTAAQPEANLSGLLSPGAFPLPELLSHPLSYLYSVFYIPHAIRSSLKLLVALNPKDEYPEARAMERRFILHIGGTNTGKTYAGFQRLRKARTGVYLAPLRLLAMEAQETLLDEGVACSLTTGEEEDCREGDTHVAATAEKLDLGARYDVAVIDECQMIADRERGWAWTRAILGVLAPEVHLCAAPEARELLIRIIESTGDSWEEVRHLRKTPLVCMDHEVDFTRVKPGDALITFSKTGVLSVAEDLRQHGKEPAIIYGALPYSTRRRQVEGFLRGDMQYVVSTDAIGMGLNLPIRRIIFMDTMKFDGVERRDLKPAEIQQIAGRAGRYGMYDKGYVGATEGLELIRAGMEAVVPPLQEAVAGFSELVLQADFDLLEVLTEWNRMPVPAPYVKMDVSRYITLIGKLRSAGFALTKEQELRCANIPFDETEEPLMELFYSFLRLTLNGQAISQPELPGTQSSATLPELELYCRKLDLFFSFAKAFGCGVDREALHDSRELAAECINQILLHNLRNNIRFCARCGAALPLHQRGRLCSACYRKLDRTAAHTRHRR